MSENYRVALRQHGWTADILDHFLACSTCSEALFSACLTDQKIVAVKAAELPPSDAIWWLAALDRQRRAAPRPDLIVYRAATLTCLLGAAATAALLWTRDLHAVVGAVVLALLLSGPVSLGWIRNKSGFLGGNYAKR